MLTHPFAMLTAVIVVLALVLLLALLVQQGRRLLSEILSGAFVFGVLVGTMGGLLGGAWCYFVPGVACVPGEALLGGPFGFGLGVLWFMFWWWREARPD